MPLIATIRQRDPNDPDCRRRTTLKLAKRNGLWCWIGSFGQPFTGAETMEEAEKDLRRVYHDPTWDLEIHDPALEA